MPLTSEKAWTLAFNPGSVPPVGRVGGLWPGVIWGSSGTPKMVPSLARHRFSPLVLYSPEAGAFDFQEP